MASEAYGIDRWVYNTLATDATLTAIVGTRIHESLAPQGTPFPYIVWQKQVMPRDVMGLGTIRIMVRAFYLVKVITDGSYFSIKDAVDRIDELLHGKQGTFESIRIISSVRDSEFQLTEVREDSVYRHRGGIYQIEAQAV